MGSTISIRNRRVCVKPLQSILIYLEKGRQLLWGEEHQIAFKEIESRFVKPPILHLPEGREDFTHIQIVVNLLQAVSYIKFKRENQN